MGIEQRLVWCDFETTGFTELSKHMIYKHKVLEIGVIVTDQDFNIINQLNLVIGHNREESMRWADDVVIEMHTKNGLWDDCANSTLSLQAAEIQLLEFLAANGVTRGQSLLWGNSVFLDRAFMEAQMPEFCKYLHFRNGDISSVREFLKVIAPLFEFEKVNTEKVSAHRAMGDITESINEAKSYRALLGPLLQQVLKAKPQGNEPEPR